MNGLFRLMKCGFFRFSCKTSGNQLRKRLKISGIGGVKIQNVKGKHELLGEDDFDFGLLTSPGRCLYAGRTALSMTACSFPRSRMPPRGLLTKAANEVK